MTRRGLLTALTGLTLIGTLGAPALAGPVPAQERRESVCLRLDPDQNQREGICVWAPITLPPSADR